VTSGRVLFVDAFQAEASLRAAAIARAAGLPVVMDQAKVDAFLAAADEKREP
jgi:hypothetical protein